MHCSTVQRMRYRTVHPAPLFVKYSLRWRMVFGNSIDTIYQFPLCVVVYCVENPGCTMETEEFSVCQRVQNKKM